MEHCKVKVIGLGEVLSKVIKNSTNSSTLVVQLVEQFNFFKLGNNLNKVGKFGIKSSIYNNVSPPQSCTLML